MTTELSFTKASGAGNDFIIVDNRAISLPKDLSALSRQLCSRHFGIGADGLLVLENSSRAHFTMQYFNSDGSYGGMCGNGGRCIARYAYLNGIAPREMSFEALDFLYHAKVLGDQVSLTMKDPSDVRDLGVHFGQEVHLGFFADTGSPHFVEFVDDVETVQVEQIGRAIRNDPTFLPDGANVNFVEVMQDHSIKLRTYERGVEAETLACGTGAVASGIISHLHRGLQFPVTVQVRSGEFLRVSANSDGGNLRSPNLEGSAHILFSGRLLYDVTKHSIADLK
jgi:diaminopimelate epimerase